MLTREGLVWDFSDYFLAWVQVSLLSDHGLDSRSFSFPPRPFPIPSAYIRHQIMKSLIQLFPSSVFLRCQNHKTCNGQSTILSRLAGNSENSKCQADRLQIVFHEKWHRVVPGKAKSFLCAGSRDAVCCQPRWLETRDTPLLPAVAFWAINSRIELELFRVRVS